MKPSFSPQNVLHRWQITNGCNVQRCCSLANGSREYEESYQLKCAERISQMCSANELFWHVFLWIVNLNCVQSILISLKDRLCLRIIQFNGKMRAMCFINTKYNININSEQRKKIDQKPLIGLFSVEQPTAFFGAFL